MLVQEQTLIASLCTAPWQTPETWKAGVQTGEQITPCKAFSRGSHHMNSSLKPLSFNSPFLCPVPCPAQLCSLKEQLCSLSLIFSGAQLPVVDPQFSRSSSRSILVARSGGQCCPSRPLRLVCNSFCLHTPRSLEFSEPALPTVSLFILSPPPGPFFP